MRLFWKGVLLAAIPSLFEVAAIGFLIDAQHESANADAWALHTSQVLEQTSSLLTPVLSEAARFRGALLAGTPSLADDLFWSQLDQQAGALAQLVSDNPAQMLRANGIRSKIAQYRLALKHTYDIGVAGGAEALRHRYGPGGGVEVLGQLRTDFETFEHEERRLDAMRRQTAATRRMQQQHALDLALLLSIVVGVSAVYLFNRSVGSRLAAVTRNAERIARGEALEPNVAGNDEITLVDRALHHAAREIEEKNRLRAAAEREVMARAEALTATNEHLRQERQDNEMFIYSVSHDLRSPLVNLEGFSKELVYSARDLRRQLDELPIAVESRAELFRILDQDFEPALRYVSAAVTQASRIIDALLKLSRIGRVELREERIDTQSVVRDLIDAAAQTIRQQGTELVVGPLPPMLGDVAAISQVFANLINNAIVYRDPHRLGRVEIGGQRDGQDVRYFVKDNGVGMTDQQQGKLFVAFKRFHPSIGKGEGIGLAYVKRVVERHAGRITVISKEGEGSTFFLNFPKRACGET